MTPGPPESCFLFDSLKKLSDFSLPESNVFLKELKDKQLSNTADLPCCF